MLIFIEKNKIVFGIAELFPANNNDRPRKFMSADIS